MIHDHSSSTFKKNSFICRIVRTLAVLLILVSQRFDVLVVEFLGTESMRRNLEDQLRRQRGNGPTALECVVAFYVLGRMILDPHPICYEVVLTRRSFNI